MAESSRSLYNVEEVLNLLEGDPDDEELDEVFFLGSDDELGLFEDDVDGSDSGSDDDSRDNDDSVESELDQEEDGKLISVTARPKKTYFFQVQVTQPQNF